MLMFMKTQNRNSTVFKFLNISASEFNHCVFVKGFTTTINFADTDIPVVSNSQSVCTQCASNLMSQQLQLAQTVKYSIQLRMLASTFSALMKAIYIEST